MTDAVVGSLFSAGRHQAPRVMVVDDHETLRRGLELLLARCGCKVVRGASSAAEARTAMLRELPDVVIVDMRLGEESGVELTRRVLERAPALRVLLYTGLVDPALLRAGLESGAHGLVLKSAEPQKLGAAIRAVAAGGTYLDSAALQMLRAEPPGVLSPRERDVLRLFARGCNGKETAVELSLAPETVRTHVRNARRKLGAMTRTEAVVAALTSREIEL